MLIFVPRNYPAVSNGGYRPCACCGTPGCDYFTRYPGGPDIEATFSGIAYSSSCNPSGGGYYSSISLASGFTGNGGFLLTNTGYGPTITLPNVVVIQTYSDTMCSIPYGAPTYEDVGITINCGGPGSANQFFVVMQSRSLYLFGGYSTYTGAPISLWTPIPNSIGGYHGICTLDVAP